MCNYTYIVVKGYHRWIAKRELWGVGLQSEREDGQGVQKGQGTELGSAGTHGWKGQFQEVYLTSITLSEIEPIKR